MASGKQHDASILMTLPIVSVVPLALHITDAVTIGTLSISYLVSGLFLSPDLDLKKSIPTYRWSIFRYYWSVYRVFFKHRGSFFNRNFFTHFPVVGSTIRLLYLILPITLLLIASDVVNFTQVMTFVAKNFQLLSIAYIGCELSAIVHLFMDVQHTLRKAR